MFHLQRKLSGESDGAAEEAAATPLPADTAISKKKKKKKKREEDGAAAAAGGDVQTEVLVGCVDHCKHTILNATQIRGKKKKKKASQYIKISPTSK